MWENVHAHPQWRYAVFFNRIKHHQHVFLFCLFCFVWFLSFSFFVLLLLYFYCHDTVCFPYISQLKHNILGLFLLLYFFIFLAFVLLSLGVQFDIKYFPTFQC